MNLSIDFNEKTSLHTFVELKLKSLSSYTTLPFLNQMEMELADLPTPIAKLFLISEIMTCNKTVILEFCDSIRDLVLTMRDNGKDKAKAKDHWDVPNPLNSLEIFTVDSELESQDVSMTTIEADGSGRKKRRIKIVKSMLDDISQSSMSSTQMSVDCSPNARRASGSSKKKF